MKKRDRKTKGKKKEKNIISGNSIIKYYLNYLSD